MSQPDIFISYRRDDTGGYARGLFEHLDKRFPNRVFFDWEAIELGDGFVSRLEGAGGSARILLALIGPQWSSIANSTGGRRIWAQGDHVQREIATALRRDIPVIPVLLRGAAMPGERDLPASLDELARCDAVAVTDTNYERDLGRLVRGMESILGEEQGMVVHGIRKENDWTSGNAFGKEVSVEFTMTAKRKEIVRRTVLIVGIFTALLLGIALIAFLAS